MKKRTALTVGIFLAGILMLVQAAPRAKAQDQAPQPPVNQVGQDQDEQDQAPADDPPGRVAQLAVSTGSVSFQPGGQGDWVQAVTNRPLTSGDNLWADKDSRAELRIGSSTIRMDGETSVTFLDLDDHNTQIKLSMGSVIVRVRHLDDGDLFEVDTPNLAFNIQRTGEYRFDVNADGTETDAAVWQGSGEATGAGSSYLVVAEQRARFTGTDQLDHQIDQLPGSDDFDGWSSSRDQAEDRSDSGNYVSEEVTGYEDLDSHGTWSNVAGYGPCWTPAGVATDWAPYRDGHWVWIAPWGWTWVDDEPWGFAPFHYGRWAFVSSRWYWVPGRAFVRPIYAPALVAFVGGAGFSLSVGGPGVAWFPLGPGEVYVPWYRTSRVYVNNVNVTNTRVNVTQVTNVYNVYRSRSDTRITYVNQHSFAVTAVSRDSFVNARPVGKSFVRVDERQIASAPSSYRVAEQPNRASVMGSGSPARVRPPATVTNREVIATRMPRTPAFDQSRPAVNVRAEAPTVPQPARQGQPDRGQNQPMQQPTASGPRYQEERPAERPQPDFRPQPPTQAQQQPQQQQQQQSQQQQRPQMQPQPAPRPDMSMRGDGHGMSRPAPPEVTQAPAANRPGVRSAPPVQERPELQRSEEQKFNSWQQQRQSQRPAAPQAQPQPQNRPQPQSQPQRGDQSKGAPQQHDDKRH